MTLRLALAAIILVAGAAVAAETPQSLIESYATQAGSTPSVSQGRDLFLGSHTGGRPDTPSCSTCHTQDPRATGRTRAGKVIQPMAPSANPARFTDAANVEKWFGRNCDTVLGRACTAAEKADIIAYLASL
jgi:cytochrome c peroxidase